jgi:hypothetical protein
MAALKQFRKRQEPGIRWREDRQKWELRLRLPDGAGKRTQRTIGYYDTFQEALDAKIETLGKLNDFDTVKRPLSIP